MAKYTWDNYLEFLGAVPPSESDLKFFSSSEWLRPLLQETSSCKPVPFLARFDKENNTDKVFNKALKTTDTISNAIGLIRTDIDWQERVNRASQRKDPQHKGQTAVDYILPAYLRPDLSGFHDTARGGLLASIFDGAMSALALLLKQTATSDREALFTANLNVSYLAPVELPPYSTGSDMAGVPGR
jgi:hypothetical protein